MGGVGGWVGVGGCGWVWAGVGGCGWVWVGVGGCGWMASSSPRHKWVQPV